MVHILGTSGAKSNPDVDGIRQAVPVELPDYFLDKFEATNKQYKAFMDSGGYREQKFWKYPFVHNGLTISREEAMKLFVDKTGVPAPSGWELGDYPKGQDDFPVSGVSWYEAAAYAEFAGKAIPTVYHWALPLGSSQISSKFLLPLSNFEGKGPVAVGTSQALSEAGTYDQCGNVKEWC
jgi:formylglycine-generating enzyme required for sulfatase activity